MKLFTLSFAAMLFGAVSFAQIPITTNNVCDPSLPPGGPTCSITAIGPSAPQPQLVPCIPTVNTLANTSWAYNLAGGGTLRQIGNFTISVGGRGNSLLSGTMTTTRSSIAIQRLASFVGSIDGLCLAGTNILAAGTIQIADGLGGSILTWSYPITATIQLDRRVTYAVTSTATLNLRRYGALDPPQSSAGGTTTDGYAYDNAYATVGTALQIVSPLACPANPNSVLESAFGYGAGLINSTGGGGSNAGTQLIFTAGTGPSGTVTGRLLPNNNNGSTFANPEGTQVGSYMVYQNCTGFCMNFPVIIGGVIFGASFEGVFAAGDFSRAYIIATNASTGLNPYLLTRLGAAPVLDPFPAVPGGR